MMSTREVDLPMVTNPVIRAQLDAMYKGFRKCRKKVSGQCSCVRCRGAFYKEDMCQVNEGVAPQHRRYMCLVCADKVGRSGI